MSNKGLPVSIDVARAALGFICPNDRDIWYRMSMALKSEYGEEGFDLFLEWSETGKDFDIKAVKATWKSSKPGAITIGTLIAVAKRGGFNPRDFAPAKPLTEAEKQRLRAEREAREKAAAKEAEQAKAAAAVDAAAEWEAAAIQGPSPYLVRKGVQGHGLRFKADGTLLVPLRDATGKLWNVQRIYGNGTKRFLAGGRMSGCFHTIGDLAASAWVLIAEGYATAATLHEATGHAVVVAFNEGNVRHISKAIREMLPAARVMLCADDDKETEAAKGKNPGIVAATAAAAAIGAAWCKPQGLPDGGTDFNDLAVASGIETVRAQLAAAFGDADSDASDIGPAVPVEEAPDTQGASPALDPAGEPTVDDSAAASSIEMERAETAAASADSVGGASRSEALAAPVKAAPDMQSMSPSPAPVGKPADDATPAKSEKGAGKKPARKGGGAQRADAEGQASRPFFTVNEIGVWYHGFTQQGDPLPAQWICSRLEVKAQSRDATNGEWGYLLEFQDGDGNPKRWAMPASMLAGDGAHYRATLLSMGLRIGSSSAAKNHLTVYIQTQQTDARVRCTDRIGWHDNVYVLPDRTIGEGDELVMFQTATNMASQFKQRGTLDEWRQYIAKHCRGNSRMLFCVSAAFAAPLLHHARVQSGGFHLWGDSSSGKSSAFKVAGSVFGGQDYPRQWRLTDNGLEGIATQYSDALLLLDEIAQVDAKLVGDTVYMLANESGKIRDPHKSGRKTVTWRLLFLSDGELSLSGHMQQAGKATKAGHDVRMAHIAADAGCGLGLYETLNGFASGAALSDHLVGMTQQYYGTAGMAFIEYAVEHAEMLPELLQTNVAALAKELCPAGSHGQVSRVATRFALVGTAGEIATNAGITGWEPGDATAAARTCFAAWLEERGGAGNVEHTSILRQVSGFFQAHGDSRFVWWHRASDDHAAKTINRAGFRRMLTQDGKAISSNADHHKEWGDRMHPADAEGTQVEYFVMSEVFKTEICKGFSPKAVQKLLIEHGLLVTDSDGGATRQERIPTVGKARVYRFKPEIAALNI